VKICQIGILRLENPEISRVRKETKNKKLEAVEQTILDRLSNDGLFFVVRHEHVEVNLCHVFAHKHQGIERIYQQFSAILHFFHLRERRATL
jgi:hypothetical protein